MRTLFWLLLLANTAFFAWTFLFPAGGSEEPQLLAQQVNPGAIRLLSEEQVAAIAAARARAPKTFACVELGSFNPGDAGRVEQALAPLALGAKLQQRRVEETAGYWVFIPPLPSRAAALAKAAELKRLGVEEYFVVQDDPKFRFAISLGVFKSQDAASARLAQLRAKGVRSARIGERPTQVPKIYYTVHDVSEAQFAKLNELRLDFPGTELKECPLGESNPASPS